MFDGLIARGFDIRTEHHGEAILRHDLPGAAEDIVAALEHLTVPVGELVAGGGGEAPVTQRLRHDLSARGWIKRTITVQRSVLLDKGAEARVVAATSHEIDHVKTFGENGSTVALEIEWSNKDPFFDRDLENFKRLHADGIISIGVVITRGCSLQERMRDIIERFANEHEITSLDQLGQFGLNPTQRQRDLIESRAERSGDFAGAWADVFVADKFGQATTHWTKLMDRVSRGVGNPCPLLLIGLPSSIVTFD